MPRVQSLFSFCTRHQGYGPRWLHITQRHASSFQLTYEGLPQAGSAAQRAASASSSAVVRITPWRTFLTEEEILQIDVLTFLLGKYSHPAPTSNAVSADAPEKRQKTAGGEPARPRYGYKRDSLEALSSRRAPIDTTLRTPSAASSLLFVNKNARLLKFYTPRNSVPSCEDVSLIHPHTPLHVVEALAEKWRHAREQALHADTQQEAQDEEAHQQKVFAHPPHLFSEESEVLGRFGMGAQASPSVPGFTGLFRQHWRDFCVTEMVTDVSVPCGGRPLSRDLSFDVPSLPFHLLHGALCEEVQVDGGLNDSGEDLLLAEKAVATDSMKPDQEFFQVDAKSYVAQLLEEPTQSSKDTRGKTATTKSSVTDAICPPSGGGGRRRPSAPADSGRSLEDRQASLQRLGIKEASLMQPQDPLASVSSLAGPHYLQCTLHKQHISHSAALANIAQTLRIHPRAISFSGIKDFIGDTAQRVRIEGVSPSSVLEANAIFRKRKWRMTLSDFSYEATPLCPGDLFGNRFKIVLRDVSAPREVIESAVDAFKRNGFPNYYGCQRFSWFAGTQDAAFALLQHNWLAFAFRFLNYTDKDRSLRELLQRSTKYPHAVQDEYRRNVVRRLRQIAVEPYDLDEAPFLSCPLLAEPLVNNDGGTLNQRQELVLWQLREAYFDLDTQSRRLSAQRLSSYLWNQALTLRLHHFGSQKVLMGDHVIPASVRQLAASVWDRKDAMHIHGDIVSEDNADTYTIRDVVHPGFSFDNIVLPENAIGEYYHQICDKYRLDWFTRHGRTGLSDFYEPPRPIIRYPIDLAHKYLKEDGALVLEFALERGCYANVAVTELMKLVCCAGSEDIVVLPAPEALWDKLGARDPGYVTSMQDIYEGFEDGRGFVNDVETVPVAAESEVKVWDHTGPLFLPDSEDPFKKALEWGNRNLLSNMERRVQDAETLKYRLFEKPLADQMHEDEVATYATHTVPMPPNAKGKKIFFKVLRRRQRYAGAPRTVSRVKRGAQVQNRNHSLPAFKTLNKDSWNVTW